MARYGMVIDTAKCVGCMDCVTLCLIKLVVLSVSLMDVVTQF